VRIPLETKFDPSDGRFFLAEDCDHLLSTVRADPASEIQRNGFCECPFHDKASLPRYPCVRSISSSRTRTRQKVWSFRIPPSKSLLRSVRAGPKLKGDFGLRPEKFPSS